MEEVVPVKSVSTVVEIGLNDVLGGLDRRTKMR